MLGGMAHGSDARRDPIGGPSGPAVVACVDVQSRSRRGAKTLHSPVLWGLAVRRLEGCLRPGDWMCTVRAGQLAVCFGAGAHCVAPGALGARLAQALGDHLSVGTRHLDLQVTVGVASGPEGTAPATLVSEAMAAVRCRSRRQTATSPTVVVSTVRASATGRRAPLPRRWVHPHLSVFDGSATSTHAARAPRSEIEMLIVGPPSSAGSQYSPAVEGVLAVTERLRITPSVVGTSDPSVAAARFRELDPDVVVIPLRSPNPVSADSSTPWEPWTHIVRELVHQNAMVWAVGVGAPVPAVAACVREGAYGALDLWHLVEELEKFEANLQSRRLLATGDCARQELRKARPSLPSPFDTFVDLTAGEYRILHQMMTGASASEIAKQLVVSLATVRSHIRSILRKLGVSSQLAAVALANGTLPPPQAHERVDLQVSGPEPAFRS